VLAALDGALEDMRLSTAPPYSLARTLASGQCFRWTLDHGSARGIVDGTVARVAQRTRHLVVSWDGPRRSAARLRRHLGADQPLAAIEATLVRDRVLRRLLPMTSGIALMRQDPWECLVSYVVSAFNNIPKIVQSIEHLARRFGQRVEGTDGVVDAWTFPTPDRLADASVAALSKCSLGYRGPYVRALAREVACGKSDLGRVASLPYDDARRALLEYPGVGEKVADCVLLYGFGHRQAFPVDVWIQRAVERWYFGGRQQTPRAIRAWARDRFGETAGYAQQHLYAGARAVMRGSPSQP